MLEFDLLVHGLVVHFVGLDGSFRDVYVRPRTLNKHILVGRHCNLPTTSHIRYTGCLFSSPIRYRTQAPVSILSGLIRTLGKLRWDITFDVLREPRRHAVFGYLIASDSTLIQVIHCCRGFLLWRDLAEQLAVPFLLFLVLGDLAVLFFLIRGLHIHRRVRAVAFGRVCSRLLPSEDAPKGEGIMRTRFFSSLAFRLALSSSSFLLFSFVAPRTTCCPSRG